MLRVSALDSRKTKSGGVMCVRLGRVEEFSEDSFFVIWETQKSGHKQN